jgi:hypothetical protein
MDVSCYAGFLSAEWRRLPQWSGASRHNRFDYAFATTARAYAYVELPDERASIVVAFSSGHSPSSASSASLRAD